MHSPNHEKVGKVIDLHSLLVAIKSPFGFRQGRLVHTSVANEPIQGLCQPKLVDAVAKVTDTVKGLQLTLHRCKVVEIKAIDFCDGLHLVNVPYGTNHMVVARSEQS